MNLQLKITTILEPSSYVNKKGETAYVYSAVGETLDAYPRKVKFDVFGQERWTQMNLMVDGVYDFQIEINSREWNGKWFTSVVVQGLVQQPTQAPTPSPQPQVQSVQQPQWNATTTTNNNSTLPPF